MPRTDENGRGLSAVLSYLLNDSVSDKKIYGALGISHTTYARRVKEENFPDAEECRLLAEHFKLNPADMMLRFGLLTVEEMRAVIAPPAENRQGNKLAKIGDLPRNHAVPGL